MGLALFQGLDTSDRNIRDYVATGWNHRLLLCEGEVHIVSFVVVLVVLCLRLKSL